MRWKFVATTLTLGSLALIVVSAQQVRMPPRTYREAIMQVLDARNIPYDDVEVEMGCPISPECFSTSTVYLPLNGNVTVLGSRKARGYFVCIHQGAKKNWTNCLLSLPEFELYRVPIPSLSSELLWVTWIEHYWNKIVERFTAH